MSTKSATAIDAKVGSRIRVRRAELGLTQSDLAQRLGITFQQVQKYEKGSNRVGASRLQSIAAVLDVPVAFFFDATLSCEELLHQSRQERELQSFCQSRNGVLLNRAFMAIKDKGVQAMLIGLVTALAQSERSGNDADNAVQTGTSD